MMSNLIVYSLFYLFHLGNLYFFHHLPSSAISLLPPVLSCFPVTVFQGAEGRKKANGRESNKEKDKTEPCQDLLNPLNKISYYYNTLIP